MRRLLFIFLILINFKLYAQEVKTVSQYLEKIDSYYHAGNIKYLFLTLMEADNIYPQNNDIKYAYAKNLYNFGFHQEALPYFNEAKNLGKNDGEFHFYLGLCFLSTNKFVGALYSFNECKKDTMWSNDDFSSIYQWALNGKDASKNYDTTIKIENIGTPINSELSESRIMFYENQVLFHRYNLKFLKDFRYDVFKFSAGHVVNYFSDELRIDQYQSRSIKSTFKDGSLVLFKSNAHEIYGDIMIKLPNGQYLYRQQINKQILDKSASKILEGNINDIIELNDSLLLFEIVYEHLTTLSKDIEKSGNNTTITTKYDRKNEYKLFVYNKYTKSVKKLDISSEYSFGTWANYGKNEIFVSMNSDDSYGFKDIYKINISNLDRLQIYHLPYPINTGASEVNYTEHNGKAYFSSDRIGGFGGMDIYYYELPKE